MLRELTKKGKQFPWTDKCEESFQKLKQKLTEAPVVTQNLNVTYTTLECHFILDTDACDIGIGPVLSQLIEGEERVIAYASRSLSKPERCFCVTRKELLDVVRRHFPLWQLFCYSY